MKRKRKTWREPGDPIRPCSGDEIWSFERALAEAERRLVAMRRYDVTESGISRLIRQSDEHDCAMITAFRGVMDGCVDKTECTKHANTHDENTHRNHVLLAILYRRGYGVTSIDGSYIENFGQADAKEVAENSFFVCNLKDDPTFLHRMQRLGEVFCQDSVFLKPRDGDGYLIGTNHSRNPGLGVRVTVPQFIGGKIPGEFLSRIRNNPFGFSVIEDQGLMSRGALQQKLRLSKWGSIPEANWPARAAS